METLIGPGDWENDGERMERKYKDAEGRWILKRDRDASSSGKKRDKEGRERGEKRDRDGGSKRDKDKGDKDGVSVEESNRIRASLGLGALK